MTVDKMSAIVTPISVSSYLEISPLYPGWVPSVQHTQENDRPKREFYGPSMTELLLKLQHAQKNHLEILLNTDCWAHPWSFWFSRSRLGPQTLHFYQVPNDIDAAGPRHYTWESLHNRIPGKHKLNLENVQIIEFILFTETIPRYLLHKDATSSCTSEKGFHYISWLLHSRS